MKLSLLKQTLRPESIDDSSSYHEGLTHTPSLHCACCCNACPKSSVCSMAKVFVDISSAPPLAKLDLGDAILGKSRSKSTLFEVGET